jgi:phage FluMu protein Com
MSQKKSFATDAEFSQEIDGMIDLADAKRTSAEERGAIAFYCHECQKIVAGVKIGAKYLYKCPTCNGKNVAWGTEASIKSHYRIKESM